MPDLRSRLGCLLWEVGITPALARRTAARGRFALAMHGVAPAYDPSLPRELQPHHTAQEMEQTLAWLKDRFTLLTPGDFLESDSPGVLLTFDDGFANNYEVLLPILETYAAPAVFFVTTQHVLNPNDWLPATRKIVGQHWNDPSEVLQPTAQAFFNGMTVEQLQACARHPLITIGSHTLSHPLLSRCSEDQLRQEIAGSKQLLEELCGKPVELFAYPTGDYDERVIQKVQESGYKAAFAVDCLGLKPLRYEVPRVGLYQSDEAYLGLKLSGWHRRPICGKILED